MILIQVSPPPSPLSPGPLVISTWTANRSNKDSPLDEGLGISLSPLSPALLLLEASRLALLPPPLPLLTPWPCLQVPLSAYSMYMRLGSDNVISSRNWSH